MNKTEIDLRSGDKEEIAAFKTWNKVELPNIPPVTGQNIHLISDVMQYIPDEIGPSEISICLDKAPPIKVENPYIDCDSKSDAVEQNVDNPFCEGDIVQLKSGGPRMTVSSINNWGVCCCWFKDGEAKSYQFTRGMLRHIKSGGGAA